MVASCEERRIVPLSGDWDIYLREHLRASLDLEDCKELIVDLSQSRLMDAVCIRELLRAKRSCK